MAALFSTATNWLLFTALVVALGSVSARWILVPRAAMRIPESREPLMKTAARMGFAAGVALPLAMSLVFVRQLIEFRDPFVPWTEDAALLLSGTAWGATWRRAATVSLAALVGYLFVRLRPRGAWVFVSLCVGALAAYPALSGHASGTEGLRPLTVSADVIHVLAAGAWIGGLAFVLFAEVRWRGGEGARSEGASLLPALVPVFSPVAVVAVASLVVTGGLAAWVHLDGLGSLVTTAYGRLLTLKILIVLGVMGLGAWNWRRLTPALAGPDGAEALRRSAARELVLAQVVLAVTAILVRTSPLGH